MARLKKARLTYLKEGETFHYENRELPVYPGDDMCSGKGEYYCISHKKLLDDLRDSPKSYEDHVAHPSNHKLVWYCFTHQRFEEI